MCQTKGLSGPEREESRCYCGRYDGMWSTPTTDNDDPDFKLQNVNKLFSDHKPKKGRTTILFTIFRTYYIRNLLT